MQHRILGIFFGNFRNGIPPFWKREKIYFFTIMWQMFCICSLELDSAHRNLMDFGICMGGDKNRFERTRKSKKV